MSRGKTFLIINPGRIPLGSSILFIVLSLLTLPFGIGIILVSVACFNFIYQIIHGEKHWIHVSRSKIVVHYLFSTVTIFREEFTGVSLPYAKTGETAILTLHTNSRSYRFGRVDNPKYLKRIFQQFKDGTLFPETEGEIQKTKTKVHPARLLDTPSPSVTKYPAQPVLTENERKGKILEDSVFSLLSSSGKIPGYHRELRNLYVPTAGDVYTEIDLLMIHDAGVYVFECKNHLGKIYGNAYSKSWCCYSFSGERYTYNNPLFQNNWHIRALANYLGLRADFFYSCIVYGRAAYLRGIPEDTNQRIISEYDVLERKLRYHIDDFSGRLSPDDIDRIYARLEPLTTVSYEVKAEHKRRLQEKYSVN